MSQFLIYIKLKPFVKQFITHALGNPVVFPNQSVENSTIHNFIQRLPDGKQPDVAKEDLTPICIPDSTSKPAQFYNYMSPRGKIAVEECCEYLFKRNLWNELGDMSDIGCNLMTAIYAYCEEHGIDIAYADTVRQRYYRVRDQYSKKGINLMKKKRIHDRV